MMTEMTLTQFESELSKRRAVVTVKVNVGAMPVFFVMIVGLKHTGSCSSTSLNDAAQTALSNYDEMGKC
jgi:hypothetical protein